MAERWATFDCYGTIVDWNGGIRNELEHLFGVERSEQLLARYHEIEPEIQAANPGTSYREVLTIALERLADEAQLSLPEGQASALARSLPSWPVFADAPPGLAEAQSRGWRLGILSNTDRDLIEASMESIGVSVRPRDRRRGHRLVQACDRSLGRIPRADGSAGQHSRPRRAERLPRHCARDRARPPHDLDQPARRASGPSAGDDSAGSERSRRCPRRARAGMSSLRARCPDCRTLTAVAVGPEYQCHSCGREFAAGLVRVPQGVGSGW